MKEQGTLLINLMSSPGSGKTTLLSSTIQMLSEIKIAVLEADIESAVDAERIEQLGAVAVQVHTCLLYTSYRKNRPEIIRGQLAERPNTQAKGKMCIAMTIMQYLLTNFITRPNFIAYNHHNRHNPVSYTHLDVYKRQVSVRANIQSLYSYLVVILLQWLRQQSI